MFFNWVTKGKIGYIGRFINEIGNWLTREEFERDFPPKLREFNDTPIIMITLNTIEQPRYNACLEEHGFKLVKQDKGKHETPIYLYVRKKFKRSKA